MEAIRLADTKKIGYEEWKRERMKGIGGSDVAAVLGISRWKSALRVYLEKIDEAPEEEENEAMEIGRKIEDFIAGLFKERGNVRPTLQRYISIRIPDDCQHRS